MVGRPGQAYQRMVELQEKLRDKIPAQITGYKLFLSIFFNNLRVSFFAILLGLIPFLFLPILGVLRNGFICGVVTAMASLNGWNVASYVVRYLAPHGIFELPAMLYSVSMGIFLSLQITKKILLIGPKNHGEGSLFYQEESPEEPVFNIVLSVFRSWISVVVPLLLVGALVEVFITWA
jgi:stage II sporulation protein M